MDSIVIYFLQSGISLVVFYLVFWFWLRKETFFHLNRYYLLVAIVVSMVLPLFTMDYTIHQKLTQVEYEPAETVELPLIRVPAKAQATKKTKVQARNTIASLPTVRIFAPNEKPLSEEVFEEESSFIDTLSTFESAIQMPLQHKTKPKKIKESEIKVTTTPTTIVKMHEPFTVVRTAPRIPLTIAKVLVIIYLIGASLFFLRLVYQIIVFILTLRKSKSFYYRGTKVIVCESQFVPYSFFNVICLNPETYRDQSLEKIMTHEQIHIHQRHYLDLLLTELVAVIQWFNPVVWNYEKSLKETHEYLADHGVLARGFDKAGYQSLLLNQVVGVQMFGLANNFNHSLTKKRIIMMTKMQSPQWAKLKVLLVLPALCCIMFAFAKPVYKVDKQLISKKIVNTVKKVETPIEKAISKVETVSMNEDDMLLEESFDKDDTIYTSVDQIPEFEGGEAGLLNFICKITKYPKEARDKHIQGKVLIRFVIQPDGSITKASVAKSAGDTLLDNEALRVINLLPKFKTPAMKNGKAVSTWYVVPFDFQLAEDSFVNAKVFVSTPKGADERLFKYLQENVKYPQEAIDKLIRGRVGVYFRVQQDGTIDSIRIQNKVNPSIDKEVIRVLQSAPKFEIKTDKSVNEKSVMCSYFIDFNFTLEGRGEFPIIDLNKAYPFRSFIGNNQICSGWYVFSEIESGKYIGIQHNNNGNSNWKVTADLDEHNFVIQTPDPWNEKWTGIFYDGKEIKGDYRYGADRFRFEFDVNAANSIDSIEQAKLVNSVLKGKVSEKPIKKYSNPASSKFTFELTGKVENNAEIKLYDANRKVIQELKITQAKTNFNIDTLPDAQYIIEIINGNYAEMFNFTKNEAKVTKKSTQTSTKKSLTLDTKTSDKVEDSSIKIYPNPNDGKFAVEISGTIDSNAKIQIYTIKGELVKELKVSQAKTEINLDSAKGSYIVKVTNGTKIVSKIVEKQ